MLTYEQYAEYRNRKNLTDYRVAKELGFQASTLNSWKRGLYTPKINKLLAVAKLLDIPVEMIVGD